MWKEILTNYLRRAEFEEARQLIAEGQKLGDRDALLFSEGMTYQEEAGRWTQESRRLGAALKGTEARKAADQARQLHAKAGSVFLKVVNSLSTGASPELYRRAVLRAADNLYEGEDYVRAVVYYRMFMDSATTPGERGQALLRSGEALA